MMRLRISVWLVEMANFFTESASTSKQVRWMVQHGDSCCQEDFLLIFESVSALFQL